MTTYVTQNHRYEIELLNNIPIIRSQIHISLRQPYKILGCYDPKTTSFESLNLKGLARVNGVAYTLDELASHLEQEIKVGSKIVARRLKENGEFAPISPTATFITSTIQRIE